MKNVTIVIPNWNGASLLKKHLPGVVLAAEGAEIIIIDDASTDESVRFISSEYPKIRLFRQEVHAGFSSSVNLGVQKALGDIVVLLNTDVVPDIGFLDSLVRHFEDQAVFAVGCKEKSIEHGQVVYRGRGLAKWSKGFYIHRRGEPDASNTAWVSGGSGAFRKSYWIQLGGMDELFNPFYWEDIDICYRAQKMGYKVVFEPKSTVTHYHEIGKIQTEYTSREIRRVAFRNQCMFIWKNITDTQRVLEHLLWILVRLAQAILKGDADMLLGFAMALGRLPTVLGKRIQGQKLFVKRDAELI